MKIFGIKIESGKEKKPASRKGIALLALIFVFFVLLSSSRTISEYPWNGNPIQWLKARDVYDQASFLKSRYMLADAEAKYKKAIEIYPKDWRTQLALGETQLLQDQPAEAEKSFKSATQIQPGNAELWSALSDSLFRESQELGTGDETKQQEKLKEAEQAIRKSLAIEPGNATSVVQLSLILQKQGKNTEAEKLYKSTCSMDKDYAKFWYLSGNYHLKQRYYQRAEADFRQAANTAQSNPEYWEALGMMVLRKGDLDSAELFLKRATVLNANNAKYWRNLGNLSRYLGHYDKSIECFSKAAKLEPTNASSWLELGVALLSQNRFKESEQPLRKALELNDKDTRAWNSYIRVLDELGKDDLALKKLNEFIQIPKHEKMANNWTYLAELQIKTKDLVNAEASLKTATELGSSKKEIAYTTYVSEQLNVAKKGGKPFDKTVKTGSNLNKAPLKSGEPEEEAPKSQAP